MVTWTLLSAPHRDSEASRLPHRGPWSWGQRKPHSLGKLPLPVAPRGLRAAVGQGGARSTPLVHRGFWRG